jgi:hypothetical protein
VKKSCSPSDTFFIGRDIILEWSNLLLFGRLLGETFSFNERAGPGAHSQPELSLQILNSLMKI